MEYNHKECVKKFGDSLREQARLAQEVMGYKENKEREAALRKKDG